MPIVRDMDYIELGFSYMDRIEFINDKDIKVKIADKILNDLPEWFGLPESVNEYIYSRNLCYGYTKRIPA